MTNLLMDDESVDDPACPLNDDPDHEDEFPDPAEDEEDAGVNHYLNTEVVMETENGPQLV